MISRNSKNVLVVSLGFLSLFTAYGGLQSLQVGGRVYIYYDLLFIKCTGLESYQIIIMGFVLGLFLSLIVKSKSHLMS